MSNSVTQELENSILFRIDSDFELSSDLTLVYLVTCDFDIS